MALGGSIGAGALAAIQAFTKSTPPGSTLRAPGLGRVQLAPKDGSASPVEAWVDGPVLPTGSGYGGWVVQPREGEEGDVEYQGVEPKRWVVPLLVDGWADDKDMQADWDAILALAEPRGTQGSPQVKFAGTIPREVSRRAWLIESPTIGEERFTDGTNRLRRGKVTLNLIAPTATVDVQSPIRQAIAKSHTKGSRTIHARNGDDLPRIAARELGDPERWREISALNGGIQPDNVKAGQKLRLPA